MDAAIFITAPVDKSSPEFLEIRRISFCGSEFIGQAKPEQFLDLRFGPPDSSVRVDRFDIVIIDHI
jgi:hypothetical protein